MLKFDVLTAVAAPLLRANVDTDAIIPSREMKSVSKTGLAAGLFAGWRYTQIGGREPDPDFVLNQPAYAGAQVLLAGENFGCGSSREHAVWALLEFGIRAIIAPSFAPIFRMNCVRNGILPVCLPAATIAALAESVPSPRRRAGSRSTSCARSCRDRTARSTRSRSTRSRGKCCSKDSTPSTSR